MEKIVSFREVHEDLIRETSFLEGSLNVADFEKKARFLEAIGFTSSIATRLYATLSQKQDVIKHYQERYQSRFILMPQLERICEKYNLFVRPLSYFMGDIPVKNIQEMMSFKVRLSDFYPEHCKEVHELRFENESDMDMRLYNPLHSTIKKASDYISINPFGEMVATLDNIVAAMEYISLRFYNVMISGSHDIGQFVEVAAVERMFHADAFSQSRQRIINTPEVAPISQVDTDPIVLCKVREGYLIVTAWGDEANDELVLNAANN